MSKSLGNFYTLRDLLDKGFSPESIRYLLSSTPHAKQLNFTFDGLKGAATAIDRLRNFARRVEAGRFADGASPEISTASEKALKEFDEGLDDNLNTAQALGAVFEFIRLANTQIDSGEFKADNVEDARKVLGAFDEIFDVLTATTSGRLAAEEIGKFLAERAAARKNRDFARADEIRDQLKAQGVVVEDTAGGATWHYAE